MHQTRNTWVRMIILLAVPFGCSGCPDLSLPASLSIVLPGGEPFDAPVGSGAASVANSTWAVYQDGGVQFSKQAALAPPELRLLLRLELGPAGEIVRVFDNRAFAPDTIGTELLIDGGGHPAPFPGSSYVAMGYGGELGLSVGFSGFGKFFAGPITLATTTISVVGTLNDNRDRLEGTLALDIQLTPEGEDLLQEAPIDTNRQSRSIVALREE